VGEVPLVLLPALSRHVPLTDVPVVSGPWYVVEVHDEIPEPPSEPWKAIPTGWLYQPLLSGGRSNVMLSIDGAEPSYLTLTPADAELPALSVQPPPLEPGTVPLLHDAMPERLSLPLTLKSTGWLYQSPTSGPRASATLTDGGVASYLKLNEPPLAVFPALSVHVPLTLPPAVSGPP
jgi:hypothetical protein